MGYHFLHNRLPLFTILAGLLLFSPGLDMVYASADGARNSFVKYDAQGKELPESATEWAMVKDKKTNLFWEVKTDDDSVHNTDKRFSWSQTEKKFIKKLNKAKFGGFSDWRMPTETEMETLWQKAEAPPHIDTKFFPKTSASTYWYYYICGDGTFMTERRDFGTKSKRSSKHRARAVRGKEF